MRRKIAAFSKLAFTIFVSFIALSFISLNGGGGFLKTSIAKAADAAVGFTEFNPGIRTAIDVLDRHAEILMRIPGIVGHGVGVSSHGDPVIKIFVERAGIPEIPAALESVPTKVEVTGMIVAYVDPAARFPRPVPIGVSTGHPEITAGTIGCRVIDSFGHVYALSNNHVYANQNDASIGDNALQPGPYDGGVDPADAIGTLDDFQPIDFSGGTNTMDAAIALSSTSELGISTPDDGYGIPSSATKNATLRLKVQKYGRTTGWTYGEVSETNVTVDVCYEMKGPFSCVKLARFVDQIGISSGTFSAGGDSGSLIVTDDNNKNPVGLLFAGGSTRTFANRIDPVLYRFDVAVDDGTSTIPVDNAQSAASFSLTVNGLTVNFTDTSTDSDGEVTAWSWNFGDGNTSTLQNPSHTYAAEGTYTVTLTVTDDDGATGSISQPVTVSSGTTTITLTATGKQNKKWLIVDLVWSGASSNNVDIYRNDEIIITTSNDGAYTDKISKTGVKTYTYKVCQEGDTSTCSNEAPVNF